MKLLRTLAVFALLAVLAPSAHARVLELQVVTRDSVAHGQPFGAAGAYERIRGRVAFAVDTANPHDARIVDLALARDRTGTEVRFGADVEIVRPLDPAKGNGTLLLEVPNRGYGRIVSLVDGGTPDLSDAGDGWLLKNGYTIATLGWQCDASGPNALGLRVPVARADTGAITGLLRDDFTPAARVDDVPLGHWFPRVPGGLGGREYAVADTADARNVLTVREHPDDARTVIPRPRWRFAHVADSVLVSSDRWVHLEGGFEPGRIYELVYVVRDPLIAGLGFAAIRDFAAWAKHDPAALTPVKRVIAEGISQNGRFLRDFLWQGFNADEQGRIALDGVIAHVAGAGRGSFNERFAQPSRDAQPMASIRYPVDLFPFTDVPETDPVTGERAGLLDLARAERVVPKLFLSCTSYEYWGRAAALIHTSPDGSADVEPSRDVRLYFFTGLQHFSGPFPPAKGAADYASQQAQSPLPVQWFWRAMIANMDAWVHWGATPARSRVPKLADSTLVTRERLRFPAIPNVAPPARGVQAWHLDFGPLAAAGVRTLEPPRESAPFPLLVPQVDADGNDLGGIRLPAVSVPLATYTGWNLRDPPIGASDQALPFLGSCIPFAKTAQERRASGDPRPSIAERYRSRDDYLLRYARALDALVHDHYLLPEDAPALLERGGREWDAATR